MPPLDPYAMSGYSDMGYDDMGEDEADALVLSGAELGRRVRRAAPAQRPPAARPAWGASNARRAALTAYQPDAGGLPLDQPLPFTPVTFTATSGTALNLVAQPQRAFQMRRIVIDIARSGATSTGAVSVTSIKVGVDEQLTATGSLPAVMFSATAINTVLKPAAARPGITVTIGLSLSAPAITMTDTVTVLAGAIGPAVG